MSTDNDQMNKQQESGKAPAKNRRLVVMCVGMVIGMTGLAYAAVPLYDLFCRVTGYGGTTQVASGGSGVQIVDRDVTVRFDANTSGKLNWEFEPIQRDVTLKLGESAQLAYRAKNLSSAPVTGSATFNVTPQSAGAYFNKIQCFCFTETTLQPGEEMEMPVVFYVDPAILDYRETKDIHTITLSYTFFPTEKPAKPWAEAGGGNMGDSENKTLTNSNG